MMKLQIPRSEGLICQKFKIILFKATFLYSSASPGNHGFKCSGFNLVHSSGYSARGSQLEGQGSVSSLPRIFGWGNTGEVLS